MHIKCKFKLHNKYKKDALQYRLFWIAIRYKIFNFVFEDYLWQDVCEKILKKLLHAENHVA